MKKLESAQRGALSLMFRAMNSTPTNAIEAELLVTPIDLCIEELQRYEAIKLHRDPDSYFNLKMNKTTKSTSNRSPCKYLQSILKQLMKELVYQKSYTDLEKLTLPSLYPFTFEIFSIPNLEIILPETQGQELGTSNKKENLDSYINYIEGINNSNIILIIRIFTDGSAIENPRPTGAGAVELVRLANAITSSGTS